MSELRTYCDYNKANCRKSSYRNGRQREVLGDDLLEQKVLLGQVPGLRDRRVVVVGGWLHAERVCVGAVLKAEAKDGSSLL